ncbi:hypothetical protein IWZ01DRAFT_243822 [Phyllosticta capitalensis]|uniref:Transmembrane protein n=1 Tax=Phyllosticta capitalensis TaxID=121624 RepID=A0ABR1YU93_9PEZI
MRASSPRMRLVGRQGWLQKLPLRPSLSLVRFSSLRVVSLLSCFLIPPRLGSDLATPVVHSSFFFFFSPPFASTPPSRLGQASSRSDKFRARSASSSTTLQRAPVTQQLLLGPCIITRKECQMAGEPFRPSARKPHMPFSSFLDSAVTRCPA